MLIASDQSWQICVQRIHKNQCRNQILFDENAVREMRKSPFHGTLRRQIGVRNRSFINSFTAKSITRFDLSINKFCLM
jgi:hypothetical protein